MIEIDVAYARRIRYPGDAASGYAAKSRQEALEALATLYPSPAAEAPQEPDDGSCGAVMVRCTRPRGHNGEHLSRCTECGQVRHVMHDARHDGPYTGPCHGSDHPPAAPAAEPERATMLLRRTVRQAFACFPDEVAARYLEEEVGFTPEEVADALSGPLAALSRPAAPSEKERVTYWKRCGWCGAYEGTVEPKEPCSGTVLDADGPSGPHQFGVYERVSAREGRG